MKLPGRKLPDFHQLIGRNNLRGGGAGGGLARAGLFEPVDDFFAIVRPQFSYS
jgi:hypothetical protein